MNRNVLRFFCGVSLAGLAFSGCTDQGPSNSSENFAIYLVTQTHDWSNLAAGSVELNQLVVESDPIISLDDIVRYDWDEHAMILTRDGRWRLSQMEMGQEFVVSAAGERIYIGVMWRAASSLGAPVAHIFTDAISNVSDFPVWINRGPFPDDLDLREDPRIRQALLEAGRIR